MSTRTGKPAVTQKVQEMIAFFKEFEINLSGDDFVSPTPNSFLNMLIALCSEAHGINSKNIGHLSFQELEFFSEPELFDSFATRGKVYAYTKVLTDIVNVEFNISDLMKPEPERVAKVAGAFMHFMKFKSQKLSAFRDIAHEISEVGMLFRKKQDDVALAGEVLKDKEQHVLAVRENVQQLRNIFEERSARVRELQEKQRQIQNRERDSEEMLAMRKVQVTQLQEDIKRIMAQIDYHKKLIAPDATSIKKEKARLEAQRQDMANKIAHQQREVSDIAGKRDLINKCLSKLKKRQQGVEESLIVIEQIVKQEKENKALAVNDEEKVRELQQLTLRKDDLMSRIDAANKDLLLIQENHRARLEFVEGQLGQAQGLLEKSKEASASVLQQAKDAQLQREKIERETEEKVNSIQRRIGEMEQKQAALCSEIQAMVRKVSAAMKNSNGNEPVNVAGKLFASARPIFDTVEGETSPRLFPSPVRVTEAPTMDSEEAMN